MNFFLLWDKKEDSVGRCSVIFGIGSLDDMHFLSDLTTFIFKILSILYQHIYEFSVLSQIHVQAYVQQLESSRLKLTQLEQELQRARQQVIFSIKWTSRYSHHLFCNDHSLYLYFTMLIFVIPLHREFSYQAQVIRPIQWVEMVFHLALLIFISQMCCLEGSNSINVRFCFV